MMRHIPHNERYLLDVFSSTKSLIEYNSMYVHGCSLGSFSGNSLCLAWRHTGIDHPFAFLSISKRRIKVETATNQGTNTDSRAYQD